MAETDKSDTEYISILEDALAAAIICLFATHKDDCLRTFTLAELEQALNRTKVYPEGTTVEGIYAKALRFPRQIQEATENSEKENEVVSQPYYGEAHINIVRD